MNERELALSRAQQQARDALAGRTRSDDLDAALEARERVKDVIEAELGTGVDQSPAKLTKTFTYVLDDLVAIPGTKLRVGIDPLLSLIPAAGTAVGAALGGVVMLDAVRLRAPLSVLARMTFNYVLDWLLGLVPFLGALFDLAYRSNHKNLRLLQQTIENREQVRKASVRYWLGVGLMVLVMLGIIIGLPIALLLGIDALITG